MNEEERKEEKELVTEAQAKNGERTEELVKKFCWRVVDLKVRKWWYKNNTAGH